MGFGRFTIHGELMPSPYECEVRFHLDDIEAFRRRVADLGGRLLWAYAFTDYYQRSKVMRWDPHTRALRIRAHHQPPQPSEVLLTWVEVVRSDGLQFKRSRFPEGKVKLYAGSLDDCRAVADGLGFEPWITVHKRDGAMYDIPGLGRLVSEYVETVGWMSEIEVNGRDPVEAGRAIRETLAALGVPRTVVTSEPVAAIVAGGVRGRKIYFCGSIRGGRTLQPLYAAIVDFLQRRGYQVLTTHVAAPDVLKQEWRQGVSATDIYTRDLQWLAECDLVIAEVSTPSLGVGVEITEAQHLGKPVLCFCQEQVALSAMVGGNQTLRVIRYEEQSDLLARLENELTRTEIEQRE